MGVADSRLGMQLTDILETVRPKTLIIERPMEEVMASAELYCDGMIEPAPDIRQRLCQLIGALDVQSPLIKRVDYEQLADMDVVQDCMRWLGVEPKNLAQLMHMNIQSDLAYNRGLVAAGLALGG